MEAEWRYSQHRSWLYVIKEAARWTERENHGERQKENQHEKNERQKDRAKEQRPESGRQTESVVTRDTDHDDVVEVPVDQVMRSGARFVMWVAIHAHVVTSLLETIVWHFGLW